MLASVLAGSASLSVAEILAKLGTDQAIGLNSAQLQERLGKFGPNALPEEKKSALAALLTYFWGPIPWMIEAAALMAAIVRDWALVLVVILVARPWRIIGFVWAYNVAWTDLPRRREAGDLWNSGSGSIVKKIAFPVTPTSDDRQATCGSLI